MLLSRNLGTLTSWKPLGHSRPVTGLLYLYLNLGEAMYLSKCLSRRKFYISPTSEKVVFCKPCIEENNLTPEVSVVLISLAALNSFMKECRINRKHRTVRFKSIGSFQQLLCDGTTVAFLYLSVKSIRSKERSESEMNERVLWVKLVTDI